MRVSHLTLGFALACLAACGAGCSDDAGACTSDADCAGGRCDQGRCVSIPDRDHDLVPDEQDNCPDVYNPDQTNTDGDSQGDACDPCPGSMLNDGDGDGVCGDIDNCPELANPDQADQDQDGAGDRCDPCPTGAEDDGDGDGVCDDGDNCPGLSNPGQADQDQDGAGDACDPCLGSPNQDGDGDGVCDAQDNCASQSNPNQADQDQDGSGDACDPCLGSPNQDGDGDGVCDAQDNCASQSNPNQADQDGDGQGNDCDPCPADASDDADADGVCENQDNCPGAYNPGQADTDGDGLGDACDGNEDDFRSGGPFDPGCVFRPARADFTPMEEGGWSSSPLFPTKDQVMSTPIVVNLTDDNGDGVVDMDDSPDVVFNAFSTSVGCGGVCLDSAVLRAVRGDTFADLWATDAVTTSPAGNIAAGDIDHDGLPELATLRYNGGLVVFEHDGALKWSCAQAGLQNCDDYASLHAGLQWGAPAIADLDGDGTPEIIYGAMVYRADGQLWWEGTGCIGDNGVGPLSAVADLDLDGSPEVVTGCTAYHFDGSVYWDQSGASADGFVALGDFDADVNPEIVVVSNTTIRLINHDGSPLWGPVALPGAGRGGAPTVADFDGDGQPEIGVADRDTYVMFDSDGSIAWQHVTQDHSSSATGSSVFDFEADGFAEVVYNDELFLRVYDGLTGEVVLEEPNGSATAYEYPVIADVDNDGNAEIVVVANDFAFGAQRGIRVFGDQTDNWVRTRRIWNQHTYHISNVREDASVPDLEPDGWLIYNSYRQNELAPDEGSAVSAPDLAAADPTVVTTACRGSLGLRVWVENRGAVDAPIGVPVAFYQGDPHQGGALIGLAYTTRALHPGEAQRVTFLWPSPPLLPGVTVWVVVDDFGTGDFSGWVSECLDSGNPGTNNEVSLAAVGCP
ncbi:MAG TPA: thrombospondin type 3 repeat-containing protein [Myxococcota bacterium]|nr:thrombospondin type 3 repeat-containing protein [Myxococcota bacterium]